MDSKHPARLALCKVRINQADFLRPCKTSWNSFRPRDKLPRRPSLLERERKRRFVCAVLDDEQRERKMLSSKRSAPKLIYQRRESIFSFPSLIIFIALRPDCLFPRARALHPNLRAWNFHKKGSSIFRAPILSWLMRAECVDNIMFQSQSEKWLHFRGCFQLADH
jgi:hypothetical protein